MLGAFAVMIPIMTPRIVARSKQTDVARSDVNVVLICANTPGCLCYIIILVLATVYQMIWKILTNTLNRV